MTRSAELYEAILRELEEAEKLLSGDRRIYASFGGSLLIEVSRDEALEILRRERERVKRLMEELKEGERES